MSVSAPPPSPSLPDTPHWRKAMVRPMLAFAAIVAVLAADAWRERERILDTNYALLETHGRLAAAALNRSFRELEARLDDIAAAHQAAGDRRTADLPGQLERQRSQVRLASAMMVLDAHGKVEAHTHAKSLGFDASRREYFRVHADSDTGTRLHVSKPIKPEAANLPAVITVSRAIRGPGGDLRGIAAAVIAPDQVIELIRPAQPADGLMLLMDQGGLVHAQLQANSARAATFRPNAGAERNPGQRRFRTTALEDGGDILVASVPVEGLGFELHAGRPAEAVLASWYQRLGIQALLAALVLAAIGALAFRLAAQQRAVAQTNARFAALLENAGDVFAILDATGRARYMSPSVKRLTGYEAPPLRGSETGKTGRNAEHPLLSELWPRLFDDKEGSQRERYRERQQDGRWVDREASSRRVRFRVHHRDGRLIHLEALVSPQFETPGIEGLLLAIRDISAQVAAEDELRHSEEALKKAQAIARIGSWELDAESRRLAWSDETYRIFDIPMHTPMTMERWSECIHPEDRDGVVAEWNAALGGEPADIGHRILVRDDVFWVQNRADPVFDAAGKVIAVNGTIQDVTAQHTAATQLAELLEFNELIISESPVGIAVHRADGPCVMANSAMARIMGMDLETLRGENFRTNVRWHQYGLVAHALEALHSGNPVRRLVNGESCTGKAMSIDCEFVKIPRQSEPHLLLLVKDVSEFRAAEQALKEAMQLTADANRTKSEFLANMSHEIRTPMNAIIGLAQLALDQARDTALRDYLKQMYASSTALLGIINDILDYSKIEAGRLQVEEREFSVHDLTTGLQGMFRLPCEKKGLRLGIDVGPDVPSRLLGDPLRIGQVLTNLVGNSVKFTAQGGIRVQITRQPLEGAPPRRVRLRFAVRDSGPGMDKAAVARLFQPFVQADGSITRRYGGTGLGLTISRRLVVLMGGDIGVESIPGRGSEFRFTLDLGLPEDHGAAATPPARERAAAAIEISELATAAWPIAGARILLVEDDPVNQRVASGLLSRAGLQVNVAGNGAEALELMRQHVFDAILMDLQMPVMDGYETTAAIRADARWKDTPIIAFTASVLVNDRTKALRAGMNDFVAKPVQPVELIRALLSHVPHRNTKAPEAPPAPAAPATAAVTMDRPALSRLLEGLDARLRGHEFVAVGDLADLSGSLRALGGEISPAATRLEEAISRYDYAFARKQVAELLSRLDPAHTKDNGA